MTITVRSEAFEDGQPIPTQHAQDGDNVSPPLQFDNVPSEARELVLIVDDPDAPRPDPWVHWVMYKIPAGTDRLPEGIAKGRQTDEPAGARQGRGTSGTVGYDGPAPPRGHGTHHYHFKLYALDSEVDLEPEAEKSTVLEAIRDHILDQGELVGTYER